MNSLVYKFFKNSLRSAKRSFLETIYYDERLALPTSPRNDDVYLVSYPKSGNTWLEFLMANVNVLMAGKNIIVNFFNIHQYMPDIHISQDLPEPILEFPGYRFIKSHSPYNPYYKNIIYIGRDPRDVMLSYYHYLTQLGSFDGSLGDLIHSRNHGIKKWVDHVDGWFNKSSASTRFIYIRYEDLRQDTNGTLAKIYSQLGLIIPAEVLEQAIEKSSFERMKQLEQHYGYGGREVEKKYSFMRVGLTGQGRLKIKQTDLEFIKNCATAQMKILGYS